jgi:hypothetical protein
MATQLPTTPRFLLLPTSGIYSTAFSYGLATTHAEHHRKIYLL